ncbi:MAG TPA: hypothetical protein VFK68_09595, partial [Propionibacteriaceae bacterium]|nr:hypothetical protein [Propionibacteriaceae bacterium]
VAIVATVVLAVVAVAVTVWASSPGPVVPAASVWTPSPSTASPTRVATTPRSTPSGVQAGNCSGARAGTPGWAATLPTGWSCDYQPGAELRIVDGHGAVIQVEATTGTPMSACTTRLSALGTAARLADTRWGGRAATTTSLTNNGWTYVLRCTTSNTYTYVMTGAILGGSVDTLVAAEEALAQSWLWRA